MAIVQVNREETMKEYGESKWLLSSEIVPVKLLAVAITPNRDPSKKSYEADLILEYRGQQQVKYGACRLNNNDGKENTIGRELISKLADIVGLEGVGWDDEGTEELEFPVGKNGVMKTFMCSPSFTETDIMIELRVEVNSYEANIQEKVAVKGFYREDGATISEIQAGTVIGEQLAKRAEYCVKQPITFLPAKGLNGTVSQEEYTAWVKAERPKGTANSTSATTKPASKFRFQK